MSAVMIPSASNFITKAPPMEQPYMHLTCSWSTINLNLTYQWSLNHTRGVLCGARVKKQLVVVEFTSFQDAIMFHKRGRFGLEKVQNSEIHVKVVLDME